MSRRARKKQRTLAEQDTVAMRRAERQEQEALAGKTKIEARLTKEQRLATLRENEARLPPRPRRTPRPGKPLKR